MARYSSESDSDHSSRYRKRRNRKSRSSSSESSDSSPHRRRSSKHSKTKRRHRSRSRGRDRNSKSYKGSRSSHSRERDRRRYRSSTGGSHSSDRTKRKARSASREKSRSPSSSSQSNQVKVNSEKSQIVVKDDFPIEPRFKDGVLEEINAEGFIPKQFTSSANKESKFKNIVIDINSDTIQIPPVPNVSCGSESIFHISITMDQEARFDRWVKKLYTLRQKAIIDLVHTNAI